MKMRVELLKANCYKGVSKVWAGVESLQDMGRGGYSLFCWGVDDSEKKAVSMFFPLERSIQLWWLIQQI